MQLTSSDPQAYVWSIYDGNWQYAEDGSYTTYSWLYTAGTQTITASIGSVTAQASVQVAPGSPESVAIVGPDSGMYGQELPLTVEVLDAYGNVVYTDDSDVTIAVASGPGNITADSTTTVTAVNGIATFNNLFFDTPGTYALTATDGYLFVGQNTLTIAPLPLTISVAASDMTYNGNPYPTPTVTESGSAGAITLAYYLASDTAFANPLGAAPTSVGSYVVVASVAATGDYDTATSGPVDFNITPATTKASLTASQGSSVYGTGLTFTVTISASGSVANAPTGLVTFMDGSTVLGTETLNGSGVAAFTTSLLGGGDNVITAVYAGDENFSGGSSNALTQSISLGSTTTICATALSSAVVGQTVTLSATVSTSSSGGAAPTGTVTFEEASTSQVIGAGTLTIVNGQDVVSLDTNSLTIGDHSILAVYSGDTNYYASTSASPITVTIIAAAPTITTDPRGQTVVAGNLVTFTAAASGNPSPTVQWQVSIGGGAFADIAGATSTNYTFTTTGAQAGNEYRAVFTNSAGTATTSAATLAVTSAPPTVTSNPVNQTIAAGSLVTFTAAASGNPSPTVQWQVSIGGGAFADIAGATSTNYTFTTTGAQAGNEYRAIFTNSAGTVTTSAATLTVTNVTTNTVVTASANPSSLNQSVTFTATVTPSSGSGETGTVQFQIDGSNVGDPVTITNGTASYTTSTLAVGNHSVVAVYSGDGNFAGSTSPTFEQTVLTTTLTWDGGGGADNNWMTAANWEYDVAPVAGDQLIFAGATQTSTTNNFPAGTVFDSITFSNGGFTLTGNSVKLNPANGVAIDNVSGQNQINLPITSDSTGTTIVQAGTLELGPNAQVSVLSGSGTDIQGGSIVLDYTGAADPVTTVRSDLQSGLIHSSLSVARQTAIGYSDSGTAVTLRPDVIGDCNMDGTVNLADLNLFLNNYGKTSATWSMGDFNYDGVVNLADLNLLLNNYGKTVPPGCNSPLGGAVGAAGVAPVPEPQPAPAPTPRPAPAPIQGPVTPVPAGTNPPPLGTGGAVLAPASSGTPVASSNPVPLAAGTAAASPSAGTPASTVAAAPAKTATIQVAAAVSQSGNSAGASLSGVQQTSSSIAAVLYVGAGSGTPSNPSLALVADTQMISSAEPAGKHVSGPNKVGFDVRPDEHFRRLDVQRPVAHHRRGDGSRCRVQPD